MVGKADIPRCWRPSGAGRISGTSSGLLARHAADRISHKRGTRLIMGNALVARLLDSIRSAGVDLRFETSAGASSSADGDAVVGAVLKSPSRRDGDTRPVPSAVWCWPRRHRLEQRAFASGCFRRPTPPFDGALVKHRRWHSGRRACPMPPLNAISKARACGCRARSWSAGGWPCLGLPAHYARPGQAGPACGPARSGRRFVNEARTATTTSWPRCCGPSASDASASPAPT